MANADDELIFDWSNFNSLISKLFGAPSDPETIETSSRGHLYSYALPEHVGEGHLEFLELVCGLRILITDCSWNEKKTNRVLDGDWIRFNFSLAASTTMQFMDGNKIIPVFPSWRIINNLKDVETEEVFSPGHKMIWVTICCKPEYLANIYGVSLDNMPEVLQTILTQSGAQGFHDLFDFTARLNAIASDIIRCKLKGGLRIAYIEARAVELLCYGLDYLMHPRGDVPIVTLSEADQKALIAVQETLKGNFSDPPTVIELAKEAGLNRNKLYYGFKAICGSTISEFVQNLRLDEGHRLLLDTNIPIINIADQVGFNHQCNFSTAIKKRYGMSPSQIRKTQIE